MGLPMVQRLVGAGVDVVSTGRRAETRAALADLGVTVLESCAEVGAAASIVCVCTFDEAQLREALLGPAGALAAMGPGSTLVIHTTCGPNVINDLQSAAPDGVTILDAPVSGRVPDILAGQLTLLVGGDPERLDEIRPVLSAYSNPILYLGPLGSGQRTKLLNNLLFAVHLRLVEDLAALAEELGLDPAATIEAIGESSGASFALTAVTEYGGPAVTFARVREFLDKDVSVVRQLAVELGIDLGQLGELADRWRLPAKADGSP